MISSASSLSASRILLRANGLISTSMNRGANNGSMIRLMSSLTPPTSDKRDDRRKIHSTASSESSVPLDNTATTPSSAESTSSSGGMAKRFVTTAEVTVSKIFPAGFCWQTSSIIAESTFGFAPETMNFALTTGLGDALGVLGGHYLFYSAKKAITKDDSINMTSELHTGILLGSAAFCSGTAWQPIVNALQGANLSFGEVFTGTWVGCGLAFYAGLRAGRTILSGFLSHVEEPTYENSKNDASLSAAIGGATGFFVGTDAAYLPDQNFLINVVGIQDGTPDLVGSMIAGTSTSMGFVAAQSVLNGIYPTGKCWND